VPEVWLWTSTDGRAFAYVPLSSYPSVLGGTEVVGSPEGFLTYGCCGIGGWSPDGRHWQVIRGVPSLDAVTYARGRFLGIAGSSVWTSRTGQSWRRIVAIQIDPGCRVVELAWTGVDYAGVAACTGPSMFVRSDDGSAWSSETVSGAEGFWRFAVRDGLVVVVGGSGNPVAWVHTLTAP
jgi:hypothetical protein